jgi:hypothetical protein
VGIAPAALEEGLPPSPPAPVHFYRVSSETVDLLWDRVKPLIELGVRRMRECYDANHIYYWVKLGTQQLWVASENGRLLAACVSEIHKHPTGKLSFHIILAGGRDVRKWGLLAFDRWVEYAHLYGCTTIRVIGRKGWLRYFKPHGFSVEAFILSREEV